MNHGFNRYVPNYRREIHVITKCKHCPIYDAMYLYIYICIYIYMYITIYMYIYICIIYIYRCSFKYQPQRYYSVPAFVRSHLRWNLRSLQQVDPLEPIFFASQVGMDETDPTSQGCQDSATGNDIILCLFMLYIV